MFRCRARPLFLFDTRSTMRTPSFHRVNRRSRKVTPRLESLEDRCLLACTVSVDSNGVLNITGDDTANSVQINDNGTGTTGNITVICDGMTTTPAAAVTQIKVNTLGGNDTVLYSLTGNLNGQTRLRVDLGTGNDNFAATVNNNVAA